MKTTETNRAEDQAKTQAESILEMVSALDTGTDCEKEAASEAIQEDPLCIEVRGPWHTPGDDSKESRNPFEYQILLATGGPAVRLIGVLSTHSEPESAELQFQDWGTPWTPFNVWANFGKDAAKINAALLEYAQQFYFGE